MLDLLVSSPFPLDSSQGNAVSVLRLAKFFQELGYEARAIEGYDGKEGARVLVVLNAWRSAEAVRAFCKAHPASSVVVQITGSDLYGDHMNGPDSPAWRTLEAARAIAIFHRGALADLPEAFHPKAFLTPNSVDASRLPRRSWCLEECGGGQGGNRALGEFPVVMIGNLRPVKAPEVLLDALELLPETSQIVAGIYGDCLDPDMADRLHRETGTNRRLRWKGRVSWEDSIAAMLKSCLVVNTSIFEGSSNALCEAMTLGVPILASAIPGNTGLLGLDHAGLYPQGDARSLAGLLEECERDAAQLRALSYQSKQRALLFTPEREKQSWDHLLKQIGLQGSS